MIGLARQFGMAGLSAPRVIALALVWGCSTAGAFELSSAPLPTFAASSEYGERPISPWSGFSIGSEPFGFSRRGFAGLSDQRSISYSQINGTNLLLGVQSNAGYASGLTQSGPAFGYDFSATSVKLGYNMGRLVPYVTIGAAFAKPTFPGAVGLPNYGNLSNNPFDTSSGSKSFTSVGAGFDYAVSDKLTVGIGVSAGTVR